MLKEYDIIVVGAGHAGCEAAAAAANMGQSVLLVTMNMQTIAQMSCNPAMGGIAKGQIVREIDALGGYSGIVSDKTAIQFRMLNRSKGPAMWSPRTQNDRMRFAWEWRIKLENTPNLDFWQDMVISLKVSNGKITGVVTSLGLEIKSKAVILTNGTFLNGVIHIGEKRIGGGRSGEKAATGITENLQKFGFESGRMKTGTPPRVDGRSLDYSLMEEQPGDEKPGKFSFLKESPTLKEQRSCHITYTNPAVHELLKEGFDRSPMYAGRIQGIGPRYCPSIEDKISRFAERERHQIFVEPEGWDTCEIYVNGFSTSLPEEVQVKALRQIPGFANVKMFRPGYAIEYDYFPPTQLKATLETKLVENLYFAGQINGTTGYEEAAGQGIWAGINASLKIQEKGPFILDRSQAYLGVLIDDLITKGTEEPYRMFTSRAEFRTLLRQDNADLRLSGLSNKIGLASDERVRLAEQKRAESEDLFSWINNESISPDDANPVLESKGSAPINQKLKLGGLITRPQIFITDVPSFNENLKDKYESHEEEIWEQVEINLKYEGYIRKEREHAEKLRKFEDIELKEDFSYHLLPAISAEAKEKLQKLKPRTIGQASRISGVNPSDISVILIHLGR